MSKRYGFVGPLRRHRLVENVLPNGKPDGTFRCVTCIEEQRGT